MAKLIGCKCSDYQLHQVGCECVVMNVAIWPKGYADREGTKTLQMAHGTNYEAEARKAFGSWASVSSVNEAYPLRNGRTFSAEYIREMSKGG